MKNTILSLMAGVCCLFILSCEAPASQEAAIDMDQVKAELQAMEDAYAAAENAKDAEAVMAYYADDAASLPSDEPKVSGKQALLERMKKELMEDEGAGGSIRFEVVEVWASGNLAVEEGFSVFTGADGKEKRGKYISVFEKRDGKYVCVRDIWNSDQEDEDDDGEMEEEGGDED